MPDAFSRSDLPEIKPVDFSILADDRIRRMQAAGEEVLECHRVLANTGDNIVGELIKTAEEFYEWDHYPDGDVYDEQSDSQFYYHAHPQELRSGEHGHFHTFLRPDGMPKGIRPAMVPDFKMPEGENEALSHLIAISMDKFGIPIRLFTTNRWVTGEVWYAAPDVQKMLDCFNIDHAQPSWPVNRWVGGMIRLFRPQISNLLDARDQAIEAWQGAYPDRNVFEDEEFEITSYLDINLDDQIAAIDAEMIRRGLV